VTNGPPITVTPTLGLVALRFIQAHNDRAISDGGVRLTDVEDIVNRVMYRGGVGTGLMGVIILLVGRWLVRYLLRDRRVSFLVGSTLAGLLVGVVGGSALLGLVAGLLAGAAVARWLPRTYIEYRNPLGAQTFWQLADRAGVRTRVLFVPCNFPPATLEHGRLLSGYPAPDMTTGVYTIYSSVATDFESDDANAKVFRIFPHRQVDENVVYGPPDRVLLAADQLRSLEPVRHCQVPVQFVSHWGKRQMTIRVQGQEQTIGERQFSDWFTFTFEMSPLVKEVGIGRFCLVKFAPEEVRLYLMPPNYHPLRLPANVRLGSPPEFLRELTDSVGLFKTAGWAVDTFRPLIMGQIDDGLFLDDLYATASKEWEIVFGELNKGDWDVLTAVFMASDRAQHLLWRHIDPEHPAYDGKEAALYRDAILGVYKTLDEWVGLTRQALPPETVLFIISDHGFAPFRKGVNLNRWLEEEGFLAVSQSLPPDSTGGEQDFWQVTDWSRTRAYAPGLAGVAINLIGREPMGAVEPGAQYLELREEIRRKLEALTDPETGARVIRHVYRREDLYAGPYLDEIPDLIIGYERGYRMDRSSFSVGQQRPVIAPNRTRWSGDHVSVDPPLVPGVFFSNRVLRSDSPRLIDLGPTILALLGLAVPGGVDGQVLEFAPGKGT
jgi:predicted AlkP superfamily phosphohydrolase/phosphomutase